MSTFFILIAGLAAQAKPIYFSELQAHYSSMQLKHRCQTCHGTSGGFLNPYAKDFAALKAQQEERNYALLFQGIEALDSDGDGISNLEELLQGRNPGDARK